MMPLYKKYYIKHNEKGKNNQSLKLFSDSLGDTKYAFMYVSLEGM